MNAASRVLKLKNGGLQVKTKLGGAETLNLISRNSPLAKDEGPRTVAEMSVSDSLTQLNPHRNRVPPSLKSGTIDVTNSGGAFNNDDQTSIEGVHVHGSIETGKI
jgi:hypothetical protein